MEYSVVQESDEKLHQRCTPVDDFGEARHIAGELLRVVKQKAKFWNRWQGLAANQIGYSKRILVLRRLHREYEVMVNPEFTEKHFPFPWLERCYSVRGIYLVRRYLWSKVRYQDLEGGWHEKVLRGPSAIYQEMDHLNGLLISEVGWRVL